MRSKKRGCSCLDSYDLGGLGGLCRLLAMPLLYKRLALAVGSPASFVGCSSCCLATAAAYYSISHSVLLALAPPAVCCASNIS